MERLLERQVDALLVYRPPAEIDDCLRLYAEAGAPVISVFAKPRGVRLPLVTNHPVEAIRRAVDRLDRLGQRSMCHVATTARPPSSLATDTSPRCFGTFLRLSRELPMRFGANLRPGHPDQLRDWLVTAEQLGFDALGVSDTQSLYRETWTALGLVSAALERVPIGPWISNPLTRHPAVMASALATLDDVRPGRVHLGIGTGDSAVLNLGLPPARLDDLRAYVVAVRSLLEEGRAEYRGETSLLSWAGPRQIPIYLAAHGARSLELAGELGDGVVAGTGIAPERVERVLSLIDAGARRSGRTVDDLDVWFFTKAVVSTLGAEALELAPLGTGRHVGARHGGGKAEPLFPLPAEVHERLEQVALAAGTDVSQHGTADRTVLHRYAQAVRDAGVREHLLGSGASAVVGTPEECVERLRAGARAGAENVWFHMPGYFDPNYSEYLTTMWNDVLSQVD